MHAVRVCEWEGEGEGYKIGTRSDLSALELLLNNQIQWEQHSSKQCADSGHKWHYYVLYTLYSHFACHFRDNKIQFGMCTLHIRRVSEWPIGRVVGFCDGALWLSILLLFTFHLHFFRSLSFLVVALFSLHL